METASSESNGTPAGRDGPSSEEVADTDSILRNKAQGRTFPGTSWFDGKHKHYHCPLIIRICIFRGAETLG